MNIHFCLLSFLEICEEERKRKDGGQEDKTKRKKIERSLAEIQEPAEVNMNSKW